MTILVKNYETIESKDSLLISYSLLDFPCLEENKKTEIMSKKVNHYVCDLILMQDKIEKAIFESFPKKLMNNLKTKQVLLVGFSVINKIEKINEVKIIS